MTEVQEVFEFWKQKQKRPHLCRLTKARKALIKSRLDEGYKPEDFRVLFEYAWGSTDPGPRWWRGENPDRKTYLTLESLLRATKLAPRIENAWNWHLDKQEAHSNPAPEDNLGPFRLIRGGSNVD